jgi:hypothetical protein
MMFCGRPCERVGVEKEQDRLASLPCFWPLYDVFVSVVLRARTQDSIAIGSDAALARDKKPGISPGFLLLFPLLSKRLEDLHKRVEGSKPKLLGLFVPPR